MQLNEFIEKLDDDKPEGVGRAAARRARQTACRHGHEFTPENTYVFPNGRRGCRTCRAELRRRRYLETGT